MTAILNLFSLVIVAAIVCLKRDRPFSPIFLFVSFFCVGVVFRSWYLSYAGSGGLLDVSIPNVRLDNALEQATYHLVMVLIVVLVGYFLFGHGLKVSRKSSSIFSIYPRTRSKVVFLGVIAWVCLILFMLLGSIDSGVKQFVLDLQARTVDVMRGRAYLTLLVDVSIIVTVALYACTRLQKMPHFLVAFSMLTFFLVGSMLVLFGGRGMVAQFILSLILVRIFTKDRGGNSVSSVNGQWAYAIGIGVLSLSLIVIGLAVRTAAQQDIEMSDVHKGFVYSIPFAVTSAVPILDSYAVAVQFTEDVGFDNGAHFLDYGTRFVPRMWWPEKPDLLGIKIRETYWGDSLGGIPPTLFGELYISWGLTGALLAGLFLGVLLRYMHTVECLLSYRKGLIVAYSVFLPLVLFTLVRSGLEVAYMRMLAYAAIIVVLNRMGFGESGYKNMHTKVLL